MVNKIILVSLFSLLTLQGAVVTTIRSGNWHDTNPATSPWTGGTVPANTDQIRILGGTTLTCESGQTCRAGNQPASDTDANAALACATDTGSGVFVNNGTFYWAGGVRQCNSTWSFGAGAAAYHAGTAVSFSWLTTNLNSAPTGGKLILGIDGGARGTMGNEAGALNGRYGSQIASAGSFSVDCYNFDFSNAGTGGSGVTLGIAMYLVNGTTPVWKGCTVTGGGQVYVKFGNSTSGLDWDKIRIYNTSYAKGVFFEGGTVAKGGATTRSITNSVFETGVQEYCATNAFTNITWSNILHVAPTNEGWNASFCNSTTDGVVWYNSTPKTSDSVSTIRLPSGTITDSAQVHVNITSELNFHPSYLSTNNPTNPTNINGFVIDALSDESSDYLGVDQDSSTVSTHTLTGIVSTCPRGLFTGSVANIVGTPANVRLKVNNNTHCVPMTVTPNTLVIVYGGEQTGMNSNTFQEVRNNIFWRPTSGPMWTFNMGGGTYPSDFVTAGGMGYNNIYNSSGAYLSATALAAGAQSTSDTTNDPNFSDTWRSFLNFDIEFLNNLPTTAWATSVNYVVGNVVYDSQSSINGGRRSSWVAIANCTSSSTNRPVTGASFTSCWEPRFLSTMRTSILAGTTYTDKVIQITNVGIAKAYSRWVRYGFTPNTAAIATSGFGGTYQGAMDPSYMTGTATPSTSTNTSYGQKVGLAVENAYVPLASSMTVTGPDTCQIGKVTATGGLSAYLSFDWPLTNTKLPQTVRARWQSSLSSFYPSSVIDANNDTTVTVTLLGCSATTYTQRLIVKQAPPYINITHRLGTPSQCVKTGSYMSQEDKCTWPDERPANQGGFNPYTDGDSYYEKYYGWTWKRPGPMGYSHIYSNTITWASDDKLWLTPYYSGSLAQLFDVNGNTDSGDVSIDTLTWMDPLSPGYIWMMPSATPNVTRRYKDGTTQVMFTSANLGSTGTMSFGGEMSVTGDGWFGFGTNTYVDLVVNTPSKLCAANSNGMLPYATSSSSVLDRVYCIDFPTSLVSVIGTVTVFPYSPAIGKRLVALIPNFAATGAPYAIHFYSVNLSCPLSSGCANTGLTYEYSSSEFPENSGNSTRAGNGDGVCQSGEACFNGQHIDRCVDPVDGYPYIFGVHDTAALRYLYKLNVGLPPAQQYLPTAAGGGYRILFPYPAFTDSHFSSTDSCRVAVSIADNLFPGSSIRRVQNVNMENPVRFQGMYQATDNSNRTLVNHGLSTGNRIYMDFTPGATVPSCLQGVYEPTITVIDADEFTLDGVNCSGQTAPTANKLIYVPTLSLSSRGGNFAGANAIIDGENMTILGQARQLQGVYDLGTFMAGYNSYSFSQISKSGNYVAFKTDFGFPQARATWVVDISKVPRQTTQIATVTPTVGGFIANYSCAYGVTPSLRYTTTASYLGGTSVNIPRSGRVVITSLTQGATYYLTLSCGAGTHRQTITTLSTTAGTSAVTVQAKGIPGAANIIAEWATTLNGTYTSGSSSACTSGSNCSASVTANKGLNYIRYRITNGGGTTIGTKTVPIQVN